MIRRFHRLLGGFLITVLAVTPLAGAASAQIFGALYESPQFGYVVEWDDQWNALDRHLVSTPGELDQVMLSNNFGRVWVTGFDPSIDPHGAMMDAFNTASSGASALDVDTLSRDAGVSVAAFTADRDQYLIEAQSIGDATIVVTLMARPDRFPHAHAAAESGITIEGSPVFSGPIDAGPVDPDPTAEPVDPDPTATPVDPEPTAEPVDPEPTATPVDPEPTASPVDPDPTPRADHDGEVYVSDGFGYALAIPAGWDIIDQDSTASADTLVLTNGVSEVTLLATDEYAGELEQCIVYARNLLVEELGHPQLRLQETAAGEPFRGVDDLVSYGLFHYQPDDGETNVLFIRCQEIVPGESVLILLHDAPQAEYRREREARAAIVNAIELP